MFKFFSLLFVYRLILGFMLVTAFLSLWISNTVTTSMMLPVVNAVVKELIKHDSIINDPEIIPDKIMNK